MKLRLRRKRKLPSAPDLSWIGKLDGWDVLAILSILDMLDD